MSCTRKIRSIGTKVISILARVYVSFEASITNDLVDFDANDNKRVSKIRNKGRIDIIGHAFAWNLDKSARKI